MGALGGSSDVLSCFLGSGCSEIGVCTAFAFLHPRDLRMGRLCPSWCRPRSPGHAALGAHGGSRGRAAHAACGHSNYRGRQSGTVLQLRPPTPRSDCAPQLQGDGAWGAQRGSGMYPQQPHPVGPGGGRHPGLSFCREPSPGDVLLLTRWVTQALHGSWTHEPPHIPRGLQLRLYTSISA